MTIFIASNNASTTLAGAITAGATTCALAPGTGAQFPNPTAGQQFALTFVDAATGLNNEVVYVTARSGDTITTMVRAQEGTTAKAWLAGDLANNFYTQGQDAAKAQIPGVQNNTYTYAADTGSANAYAVTLSPAPTLQQGAIIGFTAAHANTAASTLAVNGGTAYPIWGSAHSALQGGEIALNGYVEVEYNPTLNSGNPVYLLLECTGGALQIAPATQSQHAVPMAQVGVLQSLTGSVASNALTMTLNAPTPLSFRNPTLTSGVPVSAFVASNLSLTVPSGATLGTTSATQARLVWLVAYNGGTPVLCVANLNGAPNLDETTLISPTTISGSASTAGTIYSASAVSANSPFRIVGFCDVTETTAGTWATAPSTIQGAGGLSLSAMGSIGYGQAWQNVSGSRGLGTTFVNTTGRPIMVNVASTSSATQSTTQIAVNGVILIGSSNFNAGSPASSVIAIVPPGATYVASVTAGTGTLIVWAELR